MKLLKTFSVLLVLFSVSSSFAEYDANSIKRTTDCTVKSLDKGAAALGLSLDSKVSIRLVGYTSRAPKAGQLHEKVTTYQIDETVYTGRTRGEAVTIRGREYSGLWVTYLEQPSEVMITLNEGSESLGGRSEDKIYVGEERTKAATLDCDYVSDPNF